MQASPSAPMQQEKPLSGEAACAAAFVAEAAALDALAAAVAAAVPALRRVVAAAAASLAQETAAADAESSSALAACLRGKLSAAAAEAGARKAAMAARPAAASAREARVAALLALEDLDSEKRKAELREQWTSALGERHARLSAEQRTKLADAEASLRAAERHTLRSPVLAACYPEELARQAGAALATATANAAGTSTSSSATSLSMDSFQVVEALHRTPAREVLRCRRRDAPGAPDACLKLFCTADARSFLAEVRHLKAVTAHPLIVRLEGAFVDASGRGVLVMPFLSNGSLRPWMSRLRALGGALAPADWAAVRRTFRQLLQALAFCHSRGLAHRDLKPENVLWQDGGATIALADFGLSRDMGTALESTVAAGGGTAAYAAPEAGTPAWRETPWAGDVWALGIMALEVATGKLHAWTGRRLEAVGAPEQGAFVAPQSGGPALQDLVSLALACLAHEAAARPSADECLLHAFFCASEAAPSDAAGLGRDGAALAAKLAALSMAARAGGAPWPLRLPALADDAAPDVSVSWAAAFLDAVASAPRDALRRPWEATLGGARAPLSAAARSFWRAAPLLKPLLARSGPGADLPWLPAEDSTDGIADEPLRLRRTAALGRVLGKCLLEGLHVGLELAPTAYAALLGIESAALATPGGALAHAAAWDEALAASHRATLARRLGSGDAMLTVDTFLNNGDETPLCDAAKAGVVCAAVRRQLVQSRRAGLDALRSGFQECADAADFAASLAVFDEWDLGAALGGGFGDAVDAAALRRGVLWDAAWPADDRQCAWLDAALAALSEPALRRLLARAAGRLRLPQAGPTLLVMRRADGGDDDDDDVPRFPGNSILELAPRCPSSEALTARLLRALRLGQAAAQPAPPDARSLLAEQRRAIGALQQAGAVRRGAVFACPNGHVYTVGECGGPMERAACPECGAPIGGEQHRSVDGNTVRLDVDGAEEAAWPQHEQQQE
jgi:hypothetical protein